MSGDARRVVRPLELALLGLAACASTAAAEEEPLPDPAFLEYLGSWEGTDEDWLLFEDTGEEAQANDDEERSDPVPEGEESSELDDEH